MERAGPAAQGSITGLYTVLTEGDAALDPVAEETKSILDGHIILSEELAQRGHFPAIDILQSRSRLMTAVTSEQHQDLARKLRQAMATYDDMKLLLRIGEYSQGSDPDVDRAIALKPAIDAFLQQSGPAGDVFDQLEGIFE